MKNEWKKMMAHSAGGNLDGEDEDGHPLLIRDERLDGKYTYKCMGLLQNGKLTD
jgi:hypothetical protein